MVTLAEYVKTWRENLHMSIEEFSEKTGISDSDIIAIESGENTDPSWTTICALSKGLGAPVQEFPGDHSGFGEDEGYQSDERYAYLRESQGQRIKEWLSEMKKESGPVTEEMEEYCRKQLEQSDS